MKRHLLAIALGTYSAIVAMAAAASPAEALVQTQVEAYNAHNLEAFLATYDGDAQLFELPDKLLARGTAQLRERYAARFAEPGLHAEILNRIVLGNTIVDHERVLHMRFAEGTGTIEAVAIYEIVGDKIQKVWFRFGGKKLDSP